jgi:uncharacterized protein (DUF58 family)
MPAPFKPPKVYVLPTGYGLLFAALLLAMLVGSANYHNNMGFLFTFLLGTLAFVSVLHTAANLSGIRVFSALAPPVFAGEKADFEFQVEVPRTARMAVGFSFSRDRPVFVDLNPGHHNPVRVLLETRSRGILRPGPLRIRSRYPLGLFQAWSVHETGGEALVYPRPIPPPADILGAGGSSAGEENPGGRGVEDFNGLTPYRPGDPPGRIYWKAYSKGRGLHVREFSGQAGRTRIWDWNDIRHPEPETRLSWLCSLILKAHAAGSDFGLILPGMAIEPSRGLRHRNRCLRALALFDPEKGGSA